MKNLINRSVFFAVLVISLSFSFLTPLKSFGEPSFKDIKGHWAEKDIEAAVAQGILKGYADGRFLPDEKVSRAEFISMLNRALGNTSAGSTGFKDVYKDAWYYNDVLKAVTAGFVSGFDDGSFRPNSKITRQEAAVMLARVVPTYGYSSDLRKFTDSGDIATWANKSMSKVSGKGYLSGYTDGKIHPLDPLTRAQAARIISEVINKENIISKDPLIKKNNAKLSNSIYSNNVTISKDLEDGSASIENCVVLGKLIVQGGGEDTVSLNNSRVVDAVINRSSGTVRILAKGETTILNALCSRDFSLQTTGLSGDTFGMGYEQISLSASARGALHGNFNKVLIEGQSAELKLASGSIDVLEVNSSGRKSNITLENRTTVKQANVYGESYFKGAGAISDMQVYAKGITYETKPKKWSIHSGGATPSQIDPGLAISFNPLSGQTNVYRDTKITVSFNYAMRERDGSSITNAEVSDIVALRKGSASGTSVPFTGTINSAKTVMTLVPSSPLDDKTRYYIVIKAGVMIDENGERNNATTSYFTTGSNAEKLLVAYSPENGDTSVAVDRKNFTVTFSESVIRYNGSAIAANDSYLKNNVVLFQGGGIKVADYNVSINSKKNQITISLENDYSLQLETRYTVGIRASTLKTSAASVVPASSISWTTAGMPNLNDISTKPYETSVDFKVTPSADGIVYSVLLPESASAPSAGQIREGKDGEGNPAVAMLNSRASALSPLTQRLTSKSIERDTSYIVYGVLVDGNGNVSQTVNVSTKTERLRLKDLKIIPAETEKNIMTGFKPDTFDYEILVPNGTSSVDVIAEANDDFFAGHIIINGKSGIVRVNLVDGTAAIKVTVQEDGKRPLDYDVNIKSMGTAELRSMSIDGVSFVPEPGNYYNLIGGKDTVRLQINPVDKDATIKIGRETLKAGEEREYSLSTSVTKIEFIIVSSDGTATKSYEIPFKREP